MELTFASPAVRGLCEEAEIAERKLGKSARELQGLILDLLAAPTLADLPPLYEGVEGIVYTDMPTELQIGGLKVFLAPSHLNPNLMSNDPRYCHRLKILKIQLIGGKHE
jgi:hypothetical protein